MNQFARPQPFDAGAGFPAGRAFLPISITAVSGVVELRDLLRGGATVEAFVGSREPLEPGQQLNRPFRVDQDAFLHRLLEHYRTAQFPHIRPRNGSVYAYQPCSVKTALLFDTNRRKV